MKKQYEITRLINNNVVFSIDENGQEIIIFGKAIGFGKKRNEFVDASQIIKIFESSDPKKKSYLTNLIEDIDPVYIDIASQIIALFETKLGTKVNDMMIISLSDHISNAVTNKTEGFDVPLDIIEEVKNIYTREFLIAKEGLGIIKKEINVGLNEDEAGYIVLHYINSQGKQFRSDAKYRLLFQEKIISDIEQSLNVQLDRYSLYYTRFLSHLNFLLSQMKNEGDIIRGNVMLYKILIQHYPELKECIEKCVVTIFDEFGIEISDEEKGYLLIHINNLIRS